MRLEIRNLFVERNIAAAGRQAIELALRTGAEPAQPSEIAVAFRLEQEGVDLVGCDADAGSRLQRLAQRLGAGGAPRPVGAATRSRRRDRDRRIRARPRSLHDETRETAAPPSTRAARPSR